MTHVARLVFITTLLGGHCDPAAAKYFPPDPADLVGVSDLVVLGTIEKVESRTFTLRPEEILAGSAPSTDLVIVRFTNWACSVRWKPYAVGQREVAFLRALDAEDAHETGARYDLRSAGDEAEWEIQGDRVSVQGFRVPDGTAHDDGEHPGQWLPLGDVLDALRTYRQCFSVSPSPAGRRRPIVQVTCDAAALEAFRKRSALHAYLAMISDEGAKK